MPCFLMAYWVIEALDVLNNELKQYMLKEI
ncbi:MAG: hypothetical protein RL710_958 [Pseudomonadota bacterium]|jgi:hypothetical protein